MSKSNRIKIQLIILTTIMVFAVIFLVAYSIITAKDTQNWLDDFHSSLSINQSQPRQSVDKNIEIWMDEVIIASYSQKYKVDLTGDKPSAQLIIEEKYYTLGNTDFDVYDEYTLTDGILSINRITSDEEISGNFPADMDVFWEIVNENIGGAEYNFDLGNFIELTVKHGETGHFISAKVDEGRKAGFLNSGIDVGGIHNISVEMEMDKELKLKFFRVEYESESGSDLTKTIITISAQQSPDSKLPAWAIVVIATQSGIAMIMLGFVIYCAVAVKRERFSKRRG